MIKETLKKVDFEQEKNTWLKRLGQYKILFGLPLLLASLGMPLFVLYMTMQDTISFGKEVLGEEGYQERMNDSYIYSFVTLLLCLAVCYVIFRIIGRMFDRYSRVVKMLSEEDLKKWIKFTENAKAFKKYLPTYIIQGGAIHFFKFKRIETVRFEQMRDVIVAPSRLLSSNYSVEIETLDRKYRYLFPQRHLDAYYLATEIALHHSHVKIEYLGERYR